MNLVVSAITEGNDKPEKYPLIFKDSDGVILSKYNLKAALEFDEESYMKRLTTVTEKPVFKVTKEKDSYKSLADFIISKRSEEHTSELSHSQQSRMPSSA